MKKNLIFIAIILITAASCVKDRIPSTASNGGGGVLPTGDTLMYYWSFNNQDSSVHTPDFAVNGNNAFFVYYASYIDYTNGSDTNCIGGIADTGTCLRVRNPSDSLIFAMPTTGYDSIVMAYAEEASSTTSGCTLNTITYTTDGVNYISTALTAGGGSNQTTIGTTFQLYRLNFSSDPNVNNNPKFKVKIAFSNNNVWLPTSTSGNDRFDNVTLSGVRQ